MTNQHPITPPPVMIDKWVRMLEYLPDKQVFSLAAQWGADQELEACCEWVSPFSHDDCHYEDKLRAARRPEPPSLKDQALVALMALEIDEPGYEGTYNTIRRALEALPE